MLEHEVIEKAVVAQIVWKDFYKLEPHFPNTLSKICKTGQISQLETGKDLFCGKNTISYMGYTCIYLL